MTSLLKSLLRSPALPSNLIFNAKKSRSKDRDFLFCYFFLKMSLSRKQSR